MVFKDQRKLPVSNLGGHRQSHPHPAGGLGAGFSSGRVGNYRYFCFSLPPTPPSFIFQALKMVFWENLAFLETAN